MSATNDTATVVASYEQRARFARAEAAAVRRPRLLRGLLRTASHVAEIPCGTGHFLTDYARSETTVTLVDACPQMLTAALEHAVDASLPAGRTFPTHAYLQDLQLLTEVDLVVAPNAAVNQLACQSSLTDMLAALRRAVSPGVDVLAQVACTHPGGGVDASTFYDTARPHRVWFPDHWFDPAQAGGAVLRRRHQHRDGDWLRVQFDYVDPAGRSMHTTAVELTLFSAPTLRDAFTAAGFAHVRFLPGHGGLSEVLATADPGAWR
ncbi:MAG: methyltransferase domain-containing protein [Actinomycetota bacterium]|nr:methyltransferase domain-containing protein [Actinomycetota bacterium]